MNREDSTRAPRASRGRRGVALLAVAALAAGAAMVAATAASAVRAPAAHAANLPPGFVEKKIAAAPELWSPYSMDISSDGRLWILEQNTGKVRIVKNDVLVGKPFLQLPVQTGTDRGLMSMALDPGFPATPYVYLYYTATDGTTIFNRISRFTAQGDVAVAGSEVVLWETEPLEDAFYHYGGGMWFGADGKLYISLGDRLRGLNAQQLTTQWGKILRLNVDGSIPTDNPFYSQTTGNNRAIWALGLRNPWQIAKQKSTGRVVISDVGANTWEELNEAARGANYGWNTYEGNTGGQPGYTDPLWWYNHSTGSPSGCAIVGGDFYEPDQSELPPQFYGTFIVADHCQGWVKSVDLAHGNVIRDLFDGLELPVDIRIGSKGQIYYLERTVNGQSGGGIFRVDYTGTAAPLSIVSNPQSQTVPNGGSATFAVATSGGQGALRYQWYRNGAPIAGATANTYTLGPVSSADDGARFKVVVSDDASSVTSTVATLTVSANSVPVATIVRPTDGATYGGGELIHYAGTATDPETGDLPGSAFTWEIVFHHNDHTHEFMPPTTGAKSGTFVVPTTNETASDVFYRIHLTVKDPAGATTHVFRDVLPRLTQFTLATDPPGLHVTLDGLERVTPTTITGVEGITRTLGVIDPQDVDGTTYAFSSWSDGGAATHTISTPASDTTYTASFAVSTLPRALFVVGSAATLGSDDVVRQRLAADGFDVRVVDDDVVTPTTGNGAALVVVSSSVSAPKVAASFAGTAAPVMVYKPFLYDDMQMTAGVPDTDYGIVMQVSTVRIAASAHPLAAGGTRTVTLTSRPVTLPWGRPPSTADVVGTTAGHATLFTFSPGDALANGAPAPGCRVAFPGYLTAFPRFTSEGLALFDQTVSWMTTGCAGA